MNKEFWRTGGLVVPAVLLAACGGQKGDAGKPLNIIHIMTDDHSWQTLSAYGHALGKVAPTPNLDRLAAEGMLFRQAFVENSLSTPSRACLMTGLYSHQSGQRQLGAGIDTTKVFFSELLQAHGYETAVVGKWHLLCEPKGFDYYQVLWDQGDYYNPDFKSKETEGKYVKRQGYATTLTTDYAIDFLERRNPEKPFCLLVHHKAPHRNWMPEEKYLHLYEGVEFPYPETFDDDYATRCEPARSQEMRIADRMTMVYDLKLNGLKDVEPYRSEWNVEGMQASIDRMDEAGEGVYLATANHFNDEGDAYLTRTIRQLNPQIFGWLDLLDMNVWVILALITAVAGFIMISGLLILILERTQLIGTLKALGATDWTVRRIFLYHAMMLVARGMLWGNVIGLGLCALQAWTGIVPLDPESYYTATVPVAFHWGYIVLLNAGALAASLLMMLGPSVLASRISPATIMRYE